MATSLNPIGVFMSVRQLPPIDQGIISRFWAKVNKGGEEACWLWAGAKNNFGRGMLRIADSTYLASRISWFIYSGEDPYPLRILHNCPGGDNPRWVNPKHLKPDTQSENVTQAYAKGHLRSRKGQRNRRTLSAADESEILRCYKPLIVTLGDLAKRFGVTPSTISRIVNGRFGGDIYCRSSRTKLSEDDAKNICASYRQGTETASELAARYHVSENLIRQCIKRPDDPATTADN